MCVYAYHFNQILKISRTILKINLMRLIVICCFINTRTLVHISLSLSLYFFRLLTYPSLIMIFMWFCKFKTYSGSGNYAVFRACFVAHLLHHSAYPHRTYANLYVDLHTYTHSFAIMSDNE